MTALRTTVDGDHDSAGGTEAEPAERPGSMPGTDEFGGVVGEGSVRTIRAPWTLTMVPRIRRAVVTDLVARHLPADVVDESEIVTSELVANALRHARPLADGTLRVRWKVKGDVVEVEVTDGGGDTVPKPAPRVLWATTGRGLRIVRSVAHEWGVADERGGVTVWAALGGPSRRRGR